MPIYEYKCDDCGTKFEKLVRGSYNGAANGTAAAEPPKLACPSCGQDHLTQQLSVFAAPGHGEPEDRPMPSWERGGSPCAGGMCPTPDLCGLN
jgi:predicted nucleic acid-binding Zn ribbon protein